MMREDGGKVKETTVALHCGWLSKNGGSSIRLEMPLYWEKCFLRARHLSRPILVDLCHLKPTYDGCPVDRYASSWSYVHFLLNSMDC